MRPVDDKHENKNRAAVVEAVKQNLEGLKVAEKTGLKPWNLHTMKYIQRKLEEKEVQRLAASGGRDWDQPATAKVGARQEVLLGGAGWNELQAGPPAIDERDRNYVEEDEEEIVGTSGGTNDEVAAAELVVGEVKEAKASEDTGVSRLEVDPKMNFN